MKERNWGLIMGVLCGFVIFAVAILAGVSEDTAFIRAILGGVVGGFIGVGFNYLSASTLPDPNAKGTTIDVTLPDIGFDDPATSAQPADFVPMDFQKAARVVVQHSNEGE